MNTGENEQGLRKILDMTRLISMVVLALHVYYECYGAFLHWGWTISFFDQVLLNIQRTGLFRHFLTPKFIALCLLLISLLGVHGKKNEKQTMKTAGLYILVGLIFFFGSQLVLQIQSNLESTTLTYICLCSLGYLLILAGGTMLSRIIRTTFNHNDIFNKENETFPQEERLIENEYSINLPARYRLKNTDRKSWINFINPFRGLLVIGSPGSGKSYYVIRHTITQHLAKGFSMFIYDFKFDDLTIIAYNHFLINKHRFRVEPKFYVINFDDLSRTHRCNPLDTDNLLDITDAAESARTILIGLNKEWIKKQGDFFVESAINFLTAIIWYLRKYHQGEFCTLPHVIELMQVDYDKLFSILRTEADIAVLINPFVNAYINNVMPQLEGQIASAKISLARLASPSLYFVMSGNDCTLDINNPEAPKILCVGNNPEKIQIYGAVLSLYINRMLKLINKKNKIKSSLIFDEFPTIYLNNIDNLMATARSNLISTCLGIQDFSQLKKDYGKDQADVIMNIAGNMISGQVSGETAKWLSERFGKIMQPRANLSINRTDTSVSKSFQLESAIPASKIAALSSGEFVGMVADNPDCKIDLKAFYGEIQNDHAKLKREQEKYTCLPIIRLIDQSTLHANYQQIKKEIQELVWTEQEKMLANPEHAEFIIRKN